MLAADTGNSTTMYVGIIFLLAKIHPNLFVIVTRDTKAVLL